MEINSLENLMEIIHLKNLKDMYREINLKTIQKAICPEVGFFWIDVEENKIYGRSIDFDNGELLSSKTCKHLVHPDDGHYDAWPEITKQNPRWQEEHYEDIPRGRVVLYLSSTVKLCKFNVYMCPVLKAKHYEELVREKYNLPRGYHQFLYNDMHYRILNIN